MDLSKMSLSQLQAELDKAVVGREAAVAPYKRSLDQVAQPWDDFIEAVSLAMKDRVAEALATLREDSKRSVGTVTTAIDGIQVKSEIGKRVKWDQEKLIELSAKITAGGGNPSNYMTPTYKISEADYKSWPENVRKEFDVARTVKASPEKISFKVIEADNGA